MDKKLKMSLSIVLGGYISSLGFYFIWYYSFIFERRYSIDYFLEVAAVVFAITALYLFPLSLILSFRSLQKFWTSFSTVSIITLSIFWLIPSTYSAIYYKSYVYRSNLNQDKTIKTVDKNDPERKILAANKKEIQKQLEDAKEKIQTEENHKKEIEAKVSNAIAINDAPNKSITELQAKLESERKINAELRKQLNETIRKTKSLEEEQKTKGDVVVQAKSNKDFSKIKINSEVGNTDSDIKSQEIIFKVQIISSDNRLAINSPQFNGLKNVWEYKDSGLYKYTVGNQRDLKSASALQSEFRNKGFSGAFVVAFKNGKRIPVREAMMLLN